LAKKEKSKEKKPSGVSFRDVVTPPNSISEYPKENQVDFAKIEEKLKKKENKKEKSQDFKIEVFNLPPDILNKIKDWKVNIVALSNKTSDDTGLGTSSGKVHNYKNPVQIEEALRWMVDESGIGKEVNGTIIFLNNSSLTIHDGVFDSLEEEEE